MMSDQPEDGDDGETEEGGQPPNNQPQGGQPPNNQPQGGQPPNNQPQGGQQGGQPQGGQQGGQPQGGQQGGQPQGGYQNNQPQGRQQGAQPQGRQQGAPQNRHPERRQSTGGFNLGSEEVEIIKFGLFSYAVLGLGLFITYALSFLLADDESVALGLSGLSTDSSDKLFTAAASSYTTFIMLAALLGIFIAVYYYRTNATTEMPAKAAAIATAVGVLAIGFVLILLLVIFQPDGIDVGFGKEIPGLLGLTIGSAGVAAVVGFVLEEDPLEIFA